MAAPKLKFPSTPPKEALDYFKAKKLKPSFDYRDIWKEEHAVAFTVAKSTAGDILTDVYKATQKALEEGQTFQQFQKELRPVLEKKGWWGKQTVIDPKVGKQVEAQLGSPRRLKVIYDTNLRTAQAAGQWQRIEETKEILPFLLYELGPSLKHREQHAAWSGLVLPVSDPFWQTHMPPNGWGCKCRIRQISPREAKKRGIDPTPPVQKQAWHNERTGFKELIAKGIDPGFDFNPGQVRSVFDWNKTGNIKALPGQKTWQDYLRPDIKDIPQNHWLPPPPLLPAEKTFEDAVRLAEKTFIPAGETVGVLQTPVEPIVFIRDKLKHLVEKRSDARERYLPLIKETLQNPFEVWRVMYEDGIRNHYIGLFQGNKGMFGVVRINQDGSLFWNAFRKDRGTALNKSRQGHLIHGKKTE